ncbi:hypothetical protein V5O48_004507 [Marasmius crinis-equi]|uniref:Uncharacterized protein n=1 Tax=Marasmius crinis-equi TaxID=585013 RepID=A0ABR3FQ40_9AGAR
MDITFSDSFYALYPDLDQEMRQVLLNHNSLDLFRVARAPDILPQQKTIVWSHSPSSVQHRAPPVDAETAGVIWVGLAEAEEELALPVIVGEFTVARRKHLQRKMVIVVGVEPSEASTQLMSRISLLEIKYRVHVFLCPNVETGMQEVYRLSLALNPYCIVQSDSTLASRQDRAQYMSLLLRRVDGLTVPQTKELVARFPDWSALCNSMKMGRPRTVEGDGGDDLPEWIWGRLLWLTKEFGPYLRQLDREL